MLRKMFLRYLNVEHKWLDGTKTTVELMMHFHEIPYDIVLAYVHTDETIEECKTHEQDFIDLMLKTINEFITREE